MQTIAISDAEKNIGTIAPEHLEQALAAIRHDGFVALLNAAKVEHIDALYRQMVADIEVWNSSGKEPVKGGNFTPSRKPELVFGDIVMNPIIAGVLRALLGREVSCGMYSSNVSMPGLGEQDLHVDMAPPTEEDDLSGPCATVVVNFPLVDFTLENGATEIWPGTQHIKRDPGEFWVGKHLQDERRKIIPPERAVLPRGSALIRDIRLWHRGVLNRQDYIRPMVAMILSGNFHPGQNELAGITHIGPFPRSAEPLFVNNPAIYYNVEFTDEEIIPQPKHSPIVASAAQ